MRGEQRYLKGGGSKIPLVLFIPGSRKRIS